MGFCEHFAASFAYLMRVAGVPSRVVMGLQGGKPNELLPDYISVTEADAHSWTEIWDEQKKVWVRMDPTEVVAPLRLELGGQMFHSLPEEALRAGLQRSELEEMYRSSWIQKYFGSVILYGEFAAIHWNEFLLKYDKKGQKDFLQSLGLGFLNSKWLGLISVLLLISFFFWRRYWSVSNRSKYSRQRRLFEKLERIWARRGHSRKATEGASTYLQRLPIKSSRRHVLQEFLTTYEKYEYGPEELPDKEFNRLKEAFQVLKETHQ
ncbi:MAG: transglutaminase domain-containing protein [Bdellovibrionales bacterium]